MLSQENSSEITESEDQEISELEILTIENKETNINNALTFSNLYMYLDKFKVYIFY